MTTENDRDRTKDANHPTPSHQDAHTPDGYSFATEIPHEKAVEIASTASEMSTGDLIDFQSGLSNREVEEVELIVGEGGSPIGSEDSVRTVRVRLEAYNDNAEHPVAGEDAITLYIDCWRKNVQNTATIITISDAVNVISISPNAFSGIPSDRRLYVCSTPVPLV
jgi:hypothetical protein